MALKQMTSRRPYMLRALYHWLIDNDLTPHVVVNTTLANVLVPQQFIRDGEIVLNIAPHAVGDIDISNQHIQFKARFGGKIEIISVPISAIIAIYARENGAGMMLDAEDDHRNAQIGADDLDKKAPKISIAFTNDELKENKEPRLKSNLLVIK